MTAKVIDASALAAIIFQETEEEVLRARLRDQELHAPSLLRYELASVYLKKIRLHPQQRDILLEQLRTLATIAIQEYPVDQIEVALLAEQKKLSVYDASYLWLARHLNSELVTLDAKLERAARKI